MINGDAVRLSKLILPAFRSQHDELRYETGFRKTGFIGNILDHNLPADYVDQQNNIIKNITKEEIDTLAK
jgi:zinc protease